MSTPTAGKLRRCADPYLHHHVASLYIMCVRDSGRIERSATSVAHRVALGRIPCMALWEAFDSMGGDAHVNIDSFSNKIRLMERSSRKGFFVAGLIIDEEFLTEQLGLKRGVTLAPPTSAAPEGLSEYEWAVFRESILQEKDPDYFAETIANMRKISPATYALGGVGTTVLAALAYNYAKQKK